jgi:hypothetical protein
MGQSHGFDTQEQSCGEFKSWEDAASAWNKRNATMYYLKENLANLKSIEDLLNFMKDDYDCDWQEDTRKGIAAVDKALALVQELEGRLRLEDFIDSRTREGAYEQ